jgi:tripartite ATP-independent transporter DctM subunit
MSIELITVLMFSSFIVLLFLGLPLAFTLSSLGLIFTYFLWGSKALYIVTSATSGVMSEHVYVAIPLFIFMAFVLQESGIAEDLYTAMHQWAGPLRGGLAMGTVGICTLMAAMTGIVGTATTTMGIIALPAMLKRGYSKDIALGCIAAGGTLGILIPPSVITIVYAQVAEESVGKMFMGSVFPGLLLSILYIIYIGVRCFLQPDLGPPLPREERVDWRKKIASLKSIILPIVLVIMVLGSIYTGMATPTEAAGVGAVGAVFCAVVHRRFNWQIVKNACYATLRLTCMIVWITIAAKIFVYTFTAIGGVNLIKEMVIGLQVNRWIILIGIMLSSVFTGMFLDEIGEILLSIPIFLPIIKSLGFNTIWFGILYLINAQMDYITPPFGYTLFYLRGVAPEGITMGDIYRSIIPFVILQAIGLGLCMVFPQIVLWLPNMMIK